MKTEAEEFLPEARTGGLVLKSVDAELLVYDRDRDVAHCLNPTAARIWQMCDGRTSTREIARRLMVQGSASKFQIHNGQTIASGKSPVDITQQLVWIGLEELRRIHLLKSESSLPADQPAVIKGLTRREAVRRISIVAAISIPIVTTIIAPTAAQAGTCKHANATCSANADCCSGTCAPGAPPKCLGG